MGIFQEETINSTQSYPTVKQNKVWNGSVSLVIELTDNPAENDFSKMVKSMVQHCKTHNQTGWWLHKDEVKMVTKNILETDGNIEKQFLWTVVFLNLARCLMVEGKKDTGEIKEWIILVSPFSPPN